MTDSVWVMPRLKDFIIFNLIPRMQVVALGVMRGGVYLISLHLEPRHHERTPHFVISCAIQFVPAHLELGSHRVGGLTVVSVVEVHKKILSRA